MSRGWHKPPPVMVVAGTHEFLRNRELRKASTAAHARGHRVETVSPGDGDALRSLLSGGFLFSDPTLAIVESAPVRKRGGRKKKNADDGGWTEEDLELVVSHAKGGDASEVVFVIHHAGSAGVTTFAGKVAKALGKKHFLNFDAPKPWEEKAAAVRFFREEMKRRGKDIDAGLAEGVVRHVGTDLGMISFEVLKLSAYLDAEGRSLVEPSDVKAVMAVLGTEDFQALVDAVAGRNSRNVVRSIKAIRSGPSGGAVVRTCIILSSNLVKWIHAASLLESGASAEEASARMGVNPFPFQKNLAPPARRWGRERLVSLLRKVVGVERGVKKGHLNPWVELESVLLQGCGAHR